MAGEPPFLGFLQWSEGLDCPCGWNLRRLYVTKIWPAFTRDAANRILGYDQNQNDHNRYTQFSSSGWQGYTVNSAWTIDRLTGLTHEPKFDQGQADDLGERYLGAISVRFEDQTTIVQFLDYGGQEARISFSSPYPTADVLDDLATLWEHARTGILVVPWGGEGQVCRAEAGPTSRWAGVDGNPWAGPGPIDGRISIFSYPGIFTAPKRAFEVWSEWNFGTVGRTYAQFFHKGFFSVELYDEIFPWGTNAEKVVRAGGRKYFYIEGGIVEVESPPILAADVDAYGRGKLFVSVTLGDIPPPGVDHEEIKGVSSGSSGSC